MAYRVVSSNQTYSTSLADTVPNTPTLHATTNITISTSNIYTATYTATVTGARAVNGCMLFITAVGTGGTVTVTHQEATTDTAATASIATTSLVLNSWNYFRFSTPFVYTNAGAGQQRFRIVNALAAGTTSGAADSGGSNLCFFATDNVTGVPAATDDVYIVNQNATGTATLTWDGTITIGSGTTTAIPVPRQLGNAVVVCNGGILQANTAASVTTTSLGSLSILSGGQFLVGSAATDYPIARKFTWSINQNAVAGNFNIGVAAGGIFKTYGAEKSSTSLWKTNYVSGTGTAASPLVVNTSVDWTVGDQICVAPDDDGATNYNNTEYRYIITKNSATSYVLSNTLGGAENALVNAHTSDGIVLNIERNIVFNTTSTTLGFSIQSYNIVSGNYVTDWTRFENVGANKVLCQGLYVEATSSTIANYNYCVIYNQLFYGFCHRATKTSGTYTGNISVNSGNITTSTGGFYLTAVANKIFTDCMVIDNDRSALLTDTSAISITFNGFKAIACNTDGGASAGTTYLTGTVANVVFNNSEFHCNRTCLSLASANMTLNNCLFGTKGTNLVDLYSDTDSFPLVYFNTCYFAGTGATFWATYLNMADGALVRFDTMDGTTNKHRWYTNRGSARATGASLSDTTVRTVGTLNVGIYAEEATNGFVYEYKVLAVPSRTVEVSGFIYENAAFVADGSASVKVELFLPGSTTADATRTMTKTVDDESNDAVFVLGALYSGTLNRYATVKITVKTTTSGAYAYVADLKNGTNNIINFLTWFEGQPSEIMFEQLGDSQAVWQVQTSALTTLGTTGYNQAFQKILVGAATGGGDTSITISAAGSSTDQTYYENIVTITAGPGAGQSRIIVDYDGATKIAYVDRKWEVNPTAASSFAITPFSGIFLANAGRCPLSGGSDYIYFNSFASTLNDSYVDSSVYISAGLGAGQIRLITDYDGFTKSATVNTPWSVTPNNTSVYKVIPAGNTVTGSLTAAALEQIKVGVLATQLTRGGSYDFADSLAQRIIDVDLKTDDIEVETKNFLTL